MATSTSSVLSTLLLLAIFCPPITLSVLVPSPPLHLLYHNGPLLAGPLPIKLSLTFYGHFDPAERSTLKAFLSSLSPSSVQTTYRRSLRGSLLPVIAPPSVSSWWSLTQHFSDSQGRHVSQMVDVDTEIDDPYSLGRHLRASDIASLAGKYVRVERANSLSVVFTSADVMVEGFCMHSCGGHSFASVVDEEKTDGASHGADVRSGYSVGEGYAGHDIVPYVWVGNPEMQCPGFCAWPFAKPQYGPDMAPLKAPNGVGVDGMIITLAKLLVSAATNPVGNAFYQGDDASFAREAGEICTGKFGAGAYPGFPGEVLQNIQSSASYNMEGRNGVQFLVPWVWNLATKTCAGQA